MRNNSTQINATENGCFFSGGIVFEYWIYSIVVYSIVSFIGNVLIILTVCKTKRMRTTMNYFIVNMAVSDIFVPVLNVFSCVLLFRKNAIGPTQFFGPTLCKILAFLVNISYGVTMSSLVVITVHRFYAVAFPMRARLESRRTRAILLFCTWILPAAVGFPLLYYNDYIPETASSSCYLAMDTQKFQIHMIFSQVIFVGLPFLSMLVLYPLIVFKLIKQKVPGNSRNQSQVIRRRKQNIRLTKMFVTIIVALLLTYGTVQVVYVLKVFSLISDWCILNTLFNAVMFSNNIFHAINPAIYFIFCSSYRQAIKQMFSRCCPQSIVRQNPPGGEQIELENLPQQ